MLNETAVRALGFGSPEEAVGATFRFQHLFRFPATMTPEHDATVTRLWLVFQTVRTI